MTLDARATVGELAVRVPGATKVFERFQIDYCCHGASSLREACAEAGVAVDAIEEAIARLPLDRPDPAARWEDASVVLLITHITRHHHAYTREALDRLAILAAKVAGVHGAKHPELAELRELIAALDGDLRPHLKKEEVVLFPHIEKLEAAARAGRRASAPAFGTVQNPVRAMMHEHDHCGALLRAIRNTTSNYALPSDACASFSSLYATLEALEHDLHEHIHLESNILFPKAIALEGQVS